MANREFDGNRIKKRKTVNSKARKPVNFRCEVEFCRSVMLAGDFNSWIAKPMRNVGDGKWQTQVMLPPGSFAYKFIVDGKWIADPACVEKISDGFGNFNSLLNII